MRYLLTVALFSAFAAAQALPADVDLKSYSRLPLRSREQMSGDALRAYDALVGKDRATPGLTHLSEHLGERCFGLDD